MSASLAEILLKRNADEGNGNGSSQARSKRQDDLASINPRRGSVNQAGDSHDGKSITSKGGKKPSYGLNRYLQSPERHEAISLGLESRTMDRGKQTAVCGKEQKKKIGRAAS
ncbi:unnamed protein product [Zymoseptoria tritici ST99CH_3D7]|uniref:Uncharacterized protein n=2 Tax=Zymoseptoria tritici TaxID=1047171 RepID=A0A1X7RTM2_ZYMT9|nr:unnamed protein product [Zymoseptoria tritici ST99CH_3D7]SMR52699.1 unnamed protein product [Zymoseptoria tritici ST99CH_1E4]